MDMKSENPKPGYSDLQVPWKLGLPSSTGIADTQIWATVRMKSCFNLLFHMPQWNWIINLEILALAATDLLEMGTSSWSFLSAPVPHS